MADCLFCGIASGQVSAQILYQDENVMAFRDISPQAPTHVLVIPKVHISSPADLAPDDEPLVGHLIRVAHHLAEHEGIAQTGYRLIINTGPHSGQAVPHLHIHLLGGRPLGHLG